LPVTREEIVGLLDKVLPQGGRGVVLFATCDGQRPGVRAMAAVRDGLRFYIGTARCSQKVRDITACPSVEIVALLPQGDGVGQLRIAGKAVEVKGKTLHEAWARAKGYDVHFFMKGGLDDPGFYACTIEPDRAVLMLPGSMDEQELPLPWFA
jgi:general stress protein 26